MIRTPQGGIKIAATLTRSGVFVYIQPDGSVRREYRPASEVFKPESLALLQAAPLTNLHPGAGRVDSASWRSVAVGHVGEDVRQAGTHVAATIYVQDADTIALIESGERREISCGYDQTYVPGAGVSPEGEAYDGTQTDLCYDHVALVPRGRAGRTVGLRLDAAGNQDLGDPDVKIKIAGKEYDAGSPEAAKAIATLEARSARADALEVEAQAVRIRDLRATAAAVGVDLTARRDAATESEIMLEILGKLAPGVAVEGASPDFIMGAFMAAISLKLETDAPAEEEIEPEPVLPAGPSAAAVRQDALDARIRRAAAKTTRVVDADDGPSPAEIARLKMIEAGQTRGR